MNLQPTTIKRFDDQLSIQWNDGSSALIPATTLRNSCPCAGCKEQRGDTTHSQPLTGRKSLLKVIDHAAKESLNLTEVWAVGSYAVGMRWLDGHDTGIYPYGLLWELGTRELGMQENKDSVGTTDLQG